MIKIYKCDVTCPLPPCHKLSHLLGPPSPLERDVLYGRPLIITIIICDYILGCCECLCKKIKIGIVPSNHKIKLHFAMGFNKIKSFSNILMYSTAPRGQKLLKIRIFHENGLFSVRMILRSTSSVSCHILLERTVQTDKNGI